MRSLSCFMFETAAGAVVPTVVCRSSTLVSKPSLTGKSIFVAFRLLLHLLVQIMPAIGAKDVTKLAKILAFSAKDRHAMTDVRMAADLMHEAFPVRPGRNVNAAIGEIYEALQAHERSLPKNTIRERTRQWTERRVRALWKREARRVDHYEIQDLTAVAVEEARRERQYLEARQERLAAILAFADTSEFGDVEFSEGEPLRGLDLSRVGFTDADERADQDQCWGR